MTETPLVLLHGLGTGHGAWEPQVAFFSQTRDVIAPRVRQDMDETFMAIEELAAAHGGSVDLCGLSLGALIALLYASQTGTVRRLAVCAAFSRLPPALRKRVERTSKLIGLLPSRLVHHGLVAEVPEPWRQEARRALSDLTARDVAQTMTWVASLDLRDHVSRITCPTLVLCGSEDAANLPLGRQLAEDLPDGRFVEIGGAGHVANLDAPGAFTRAVDDFLGR